MTKAEKTIREYLEMLLTSLDDSVLYIPPEPDGWVYHGLADFLLQHGVMFPTKGGHATGHYPRACYTISRQNAKTYPNYLYAEGMAVGDYGLPTEHAWNIRPDGTILDMSWGMLGEAYFGVAFRAPRLRSGQLPSLLDETAARKRRHSVYTVPWEQNQLNPSVSSAKRKERGIYAG